MNLTLGLAAATLAFGLAGASAVALDFDQQATSAPERAGLMPSQGGSAAGLSAIGATKNARPGDDVAIEHAYGEGLTPPAEDHTWRSGLAALSEALPRDATLSKNAQQALMPPEGFQANTDGFAAMKTTAGLGGAEADLMGASSGAVENALPSLLAAPSK